MFNIPAQASPLQHTQTAFVLETAPAIKYISEDQDEISDSLITRYQISI